MSERVDMLIPKVAVVTDIIRETPDVKTFRVRTPDGGKPIQHMPGQCAMVSVPGVGEGMFSIPSSPTIDDYIEFSIKKCGCVTDWLHSMEPGQQVTVRGPLGNHFPVESDLQGKDLLFIAGGIGVAPLHSVIAYCLAHREEYGRIDVIYGARSKDDLVYLQEMQEEWPKYDNVHVHLTIDRAQEGWDGHVGFVPNYVMELTELTLNETVLVCGPPVMIKFTMQNLMKLGYKRENVYTTMELRMKCGIGKCGRCNIGSKYVCKDGPVFRFDQLDELPNEY